MRSYPIPHVNFTIFIKKTTNFTIVPSKTFLLYSRRGIQEKKRFSALGSVEAEKKLTCVIQLKTVCVLLLLLPLLLPLLPFLLLRANLPACFRYVPDHVASWNFKHGYFSAGAIQSTIPHPSSTIISIFFLLSKNEKLPVDLHVKFRCTLTCKNINMWISRNLEQLKTLFFCWNRLVEGRKKDFVDDIVKFLHFVIFNILVNVEIGSFS